MQGPRQLSKLPILRIVNGTIYRHHPNSQTNANPALFENISFELPSYSAEPHSWCIVGPSLSGKTTFLEALRGQHVCHPPTARTFPYLSSGVLPQVRRGKALPETPEPLRPVFLHVELEAVRVADISQWLKQILGTKVTVIEDGNRNGLLLSGTQSDMRAALDVIQSLDQPRMRGRVARRITPAFAADSSPELAAQAVNVCATFVSIGIVTDVDRNCRSFNSKFIRRFLSSCFYLTGQRPRGTYRCR